MNALVRVENALCRVGRHAVLKLNQFQIDQGQHWCLLGPNGSGKTLFGNLLSGKRIESGSYVSYVKGFDPARDIHIVSFEEQQKLWQRDNRLDISEYNADAQDTGTRVNELIASTRPKIQFDQDLFTQLVEELGLTGLVDKGIRFLSSGQTRKVLIARALFAHRDGIPQLLILDDPLESIDQDSQSRIKNTLKKFLNENFSSIQLCRRTTDVLPNVNYIALMKDLTIATQGPRAEIEASSFFTELCAIKPTIPQELPAIQSREPKTNSVTGDLIRLENINASYGELVVFENFSWTMAQKDHVLIEGPNGCGKSTLLSLVNGENHKAYGQDVILFGKKKGSGETIWELKAKFGVVSNELHNRYVKGWKVLDVVVSGYFDSVGLYDDSGSKEIAHAKNWLKTLGIEELAQHFYQEISFGQQRLVLLARAMVKAPRILILDEPCVGLDDYHRQLILGVLDKIAEQTATQLIYVSHVANERPQCINNYLRFIANEQGGYRIQQTDF